MSVTDFDEVLHLWRNTEGVGLNESDTRSELKKYLHRNRGLSVVARNSEGTVVGAVLCGHDGRRGYMHHLAIAKEHRRCGLGRRLVETCLETLRAQGIRKCNIFLLADNHQGERFWQRLGWKGRHDLRVMQKVCGV